MKKTLLICLVVSAVITLCSAAIWAEYPTTLWTASAAEVIPTGTVYEIYTPEQLAWVSLRVQNKEDNFYDKTVRLMNNISLAGKLWVPIGNLTYAFQGTFDGQGHSVSGLVITDMSATGTYIGFFGYTDNSVVRNLTLDGITIDVTYVEGCGGVTGYIYRGDVNNCSVSGNITCETNSRDFDVGGINGYGGTVTGCYSSAVIKAKGKRTINAGGIVGLCDEGDITDCTSSGSLEVNCYIGKVGGICGYQYKNKIANCSSDTVVNTVFNCTDSCYTGGITGRNYSGDVLMNCNFGGSITVTFAGTESLYVGGVIGRNYDNSCVRNCSSKGSINVYYNGLESGYVGGVIGRNNGLGTVINSSAAGAIVISTTGTGSCYSAALCARNNSGGSLVNSYAVLSLTTANRSGGVTYNNEGTVENCYCAVSFSAPSGYYLTYYNSGSMKNVYYNKDLTKNLSEVYSNTGTFTGCTGMSTIDMLLDGFTVALNSYWNGAEVRHRYWRTDTENLNGGYPRLLVPSVTGLSFTVPAFIGGDVRAILSGVNFGGAEELRINNLAFDRTTGSVRIPVMASDWTLIADGFVYDYVYSVYFDGSVIYSGTQQFKIAYDINIPPNITGISFPPDLGAGGGAFRVVLNGTNLHYAILSGKIRLSAETADGLNRLSAYAKIENDACAATLTLPANLTGAPVAYNLKVYIDNNEQVLTGATQMLVRSESGIADRFDHNGDGAVNILDLIVLTRYLLAN